MQTTRESMLQHGCVLNQMKQAVNNPGFIKCDAQQKQHLYKEIKWGTSNTELYHAALLSSMKIHSCCVTGAVHWDQ